MQVHLLVVQSPDGEDVQGAFAENADDPLDAGKAALAEDSPQGEAEWGVLAVGLLAFRAVEGSRTRRRRKKLVVCIK